MHNFTWIDECYKAYEEPKRFLRSLLLLSKPKVEEGLYLYLAASLEAMNFILVQVDDKEVQKHIYYTS